MPSPDFTRIERAIRFLDASAPGQPRLREVAQHVGLSQYHFQRLFRRWAGVSPKRFLQFLTADEAVRLLRESGSTLAVTHEVGLSSPSRLHDLLVHTEAVTPGEVKQGGEGLDIVWGRHPTPFGECFIAATQRGVCDLAFLVGGESGDPAGALRRRWPRATTRQDPEATGRLVERIFEPGSAPGGSLSLHLRGTNFQLKVWRALLEVAPGQVTTYGEIADGIGAPSAARAVGGAVGSNVVAFLIPCHRVIRSTGAFGGYRWGSERKRALLAWEAARRTGWKTTPAASAIPIPVDG